MKVINNYSWYKDCDKKKCNFRTTLVCDVMKGEKKNYSKIVTFIILIILSSYMLLSYEPNTFPLPRKKKS